tara:strand:+ start:17542 stop:17868 length:327 start_codon:yes stop_codon:yes gene_type:complete
VIVLGRADRIATAGRRTAKEAREAASKRRQTERQKVSQKSLEVRPHRHCVVCWTPISIDSDPAVCNDSACIENNEKRESSRKRLTIMLYLFPGIAILLIFLQLMSGGA